MDIMDIQAVESKLSDVTVTPIPRSQVQNFYNYQQREQREQQPQIQISAIRTNNNHNNNNNQSINDHPAHSRSVGRNDLYGKNERDYHSVSNSSAVTAAAALQYTQQLQAQLALLQQHSNTTASPAMARSTANTSNSSSSANGMSGLSSALTAVMAAAVASQSQHKYPQSTSPLVMSSQQPSSSSASSLAALANTHNLVSAVNLATSSNAGSSNSSSSSSANGLSKYGQLLTVIEELGRDIRPTYTGSRCSTERLKRSLVHARILVRECLMETERSARP